MYKKIIIFLLCIIAFSLKINVSIADTNQLWIGEWTYINTDLPVEVRYSHWNLNEKTFIVTWDLELGNNITIDGNIMVYGNFTAGDSLDVSWYLVSSWDIQAWNQLTVDWVMKWKNITMGSSFTGNRVIALWNMFTKWSVNIINGIYITWDFTSWSELFLSWKSKVLWNLIIWPYSKVQGSLYVYKSMKTSFDFEFIWEKLKVIWDFDTLRWPEKWSLLQWRTYIYWDLWHRYIYWNKIVFHRYEIIQEKYPWLIWKIDVILKYRLSEQEILHIKNQVSLFQDDISSQKDRLISLSKKSPKSQAIIRKKEEIYDTYNSMFQYISTYIESENWDRKEFKKIKREEFTKLNVFLNQFHWNIKDIEIYNY